ncbi:hypothetical protein NEOLEDRAFT_1239318 [Neolentinus lepideus HHB14362 ss-1]|uniref:Zn(2)-C6 fungal-type domain-containing protein n=1 Tax=Neolentinus lepideus HHB14362 ss-1 TaxID=1314782 RepID=A0A165UWK2_9AGAM|nr:hypothetical protein NEOLEDRAFT_1239318 [Neolentinus lepideus HHB14362 ss-1]
MKPNGKPRGSYARRACNHCRQRKSRCDGQEPICGPCQLTGHECTWGPESAKKPNTRQYVEMLKNRIKVLEINLKAAEEQLAQYRQKDSPQAAESPSGAFASGSPSEDAPDPDPEERSESPTSDSELDQLCGATQQLVLQDNDLQVFGPTSVYRLSPNVPAPQRSPKIADRYRFDYGRILDDRWRRYLPSEVPLDRADHDFLLDLCFKFFTSWCMRVVPELFLRDMYIFLSVSETEPPPKTPHYSPMLHNALLALSLAFSDKPHLKDVNTRRMFANQAKTDIEKECERPSISVVHALSLIGSFHSTQGEQTLGYMYFGMSSRMSQALGLCVDCSPWVKCGLISDDDMLARNWAYWTTFSQDVCWSLHVGREFCVQEPSDKTKIPVPFVDSEFDQIQYLCPEPFKVPAQPSLLSSTFAASCDLLKIARRIMDIVNGLSVRTRYETQLKLISEIDLQLNAWKDALPKELDLTHSNRITALPHRLMMHLAYWWCFVLLHRPFYRRPRPVHGTSVQDLDHAKLCNAAAGEITKILETWTSLYSLRYAPITLIQVAYSAGTVYILSSVQAMSRPRLAEVALSNSVSKAEMCIQYLREAGKSWECGNQVADILQGLLQKQLRARLEMRAVDRPRLLVNVPAAMKQPQSSKSVSQAASQAQVSLQHPQQEYSVSPTATSSSSGSVPLISPVGSFTDAHTLQYLMLGYSPTSPSASTMPSGSGLSPVDLPLFHHPSSTSQEMAWPQLDYGGIPDMGMGMLNGESFPRQPYTTFTSGGLSGTDFSFGDLTVHNGPEMSPDDVALLQDLMKEQHWTPR